MPSPLAEAIIQIGVDLSGLQVGLTRARSRLQEQILSMGAAMTVRATEAFSNFELAMSRVEGLVGLTAGEVRTFTADILNLSKALGKPPDELASALYFITSAGLRGTAALDALTASARASVAGLGETRVVADAVTSALNAYSRSGLTSAQITDALTAAVREGKVAASELAPSLGRILPIASSMNVALTDVLGTLAVLTRTGSSASEAVTGIRAVLLSLLAPSAGASKAIKAAGLDLGQLREMVQKPGGLVQALRLLHEAFKNNEDGLSDVLPNVRALSASLSVLSQDATAVDGVLAGVRNSAGSLDKAFGVTANTLSFQWGRVAAQFKTTLVDVGGVIGSRLMPLLEGFSSRFAAAWDSVKAGAPAVLASLGGVLSALQAHGRTIGVVAVTIGAAALAYRGLSLAAGAVGAVLAGLRGQLLAGLSGGGLLMGAGVVAALAAAVGALGSSGAVAEGIAETFGAAWERVKELTDQTWPYVRASVAAAAAGVYGAVSAAAAGITSAWDWGRAKASTIDAWGYVRAVVAGAVLGAYGVVTFATSAISAAWDLMGSTVRAVTGFVVENAQALALAGGVVLGAVAAYKTLTAAMTLLHVQQIAGAALWVLWTAATVAAKGAALLFQAVYTTAMVAATAAVSLFATGQGAAAVATAALNAALTVTNVLMAGATFVAAAAGVAAVTVAVGVAAAGVWALWESLKAVKEAISFTPTGGFFELGGVFSQWGDMIANVVRAARTDLPLAFELAKASAALAVAQVQAMWPPLWTFVREGFSTLWTLVTTTFVSSFTGMIADITERTLSFFKIWDLVPGNPFAGILDQATAALKTFQSDAAAAKVAALTAAKAGLAGAAAKLTFNLDTTDIRAAREQVDKLMNDLRVAEEVRWWERTLGPLTGPAGPKAPGAPPVVAAPAVQHEIKVSHSGIADLYRSIQEKLTGGGTDKLIARNTGAAAAGVEKTNELLGKVIARLDNPGGAGAVFS
jgi:TP901 family phage tail tape measure protein